MTMISFFPKLVCDFNAILYIDNLIFFKLELGKLIMKNSFGRMKKHEYPANS